MFTIMENKIEKKIKEQELKRLDYQNQKNMINKEVNQVNELITYYDDIKMNKKVMVISLLFDLGSFFLIPILPEVGLSLSIFLTCAVFGAQSGIKENKRVINNSDYLGNKDYKSLNKQFQLLDVEKQNIDKLMNTLDQSNKLYSNLKDRIDYFKERMDSTNSLFDCTYNELYDLLRKNPILAFDSEDEYKNFMTYDSETQNNIISSKILIKRK